jgi:AraC family transcriptional activator of pobA
MESFSETNCTCFELRLLEEMINQESLTLVNPQTGHLAFKIVPFEDGAEFSRVQRNNYYSLVWVTEGNGKVNVDLIEHAFAENTLFAFSPYQPFMFSTAKIKGVAIHFHPDFFCIHKHQHEVACNGILFNNIYQVPYCSVDTVSVSSLSLLVDQMKSEIKNSALARYEILVSYLKIFLIQASRLRLGQQPEVLTRRDLKEPPILQTLKDTIERDFKKKHLPRDYAEALHISSGALAKMTKTYFHKTLTELISERIIIEAKRELYLTNKSIKEIARELGYDDEHYFSRFFRTNMDISPQAYRETVGFDRGEN